MARVSDPRLASAWRRRIVAQGRSGLSIVEFCRREGVSPASFHGWKRRLRATTNAKGAAPRAKRTKAVARQIPAEGSFWQVPLAMTACLELRLPDGTVVRLPPDNLAALATALSTLRAPSRQGGDHA